MRSKQTKAHDITKKVRDAVKERDGGRCIFCGSHDLLQIAHYIGRGCGGLGVEPNLACACVRCHHELDQGMNRAMYREFFKDYLEARYPGFPDSERKYNKWKK